MRWWKEGKNKEKKEKKKVLDELQRSDATEKCCNIYHAIYVTKIKTVQNYMNKSICILGLYAMLKMLKATLFTILKKKKKKKKKLLQKDFLLCVIVSNQPCTKSLDCNLI